MRNTYLAVILATVVLAGAGKASDWDSGLRAVEIFSGYGYGSLDGQADYEFFPLAVDLTWPVPVRNPDSSWQFQLEPFLSWVASPESNAEAGCAFFFKYRFGRNRIQPYLKGGSGVILMTQETSEQSTRFNFISQAVAGIHWMLRSGPGSDGISLEYRFRHISNAGIREPNSGVNSRAILLGWLKPL